MNIDFEGMYRQARAEATDVSEHLLHYLDTIESPLWRLQLLGLLSPRMRSATGAKAYRPGSPGTLREWHWRAIVEAWKARHVGVEDENGYYGHGHSGWNTWLRLRDFKAGPLIEEYSTWGEYNAYTGYTPQIHWLKLSALGELATIP